MPRPKSLFAPQAAGGALTRDGARALVDRIFAFSKADSIRVNIRSGWAGNTRFAGGQITTSGNTADTSVSILSTIGRRRASATTNVLDDESLRRTVDLSERLARLSPEDPELMPELGEQRYLNINTWFDSTASLSPDERAAAAGAVIGAGESAWASAPNASGSLFVAGFLDADASATVVANNKGLFAWQRSTSVRLSNTARTPDGTGSGWSSASARDWRKVQPGALGMRAADKAVRSRSPVELEPGFYTVVLESAAAGQLIGQVSGALNARAAEEGRNAFSKAGGTRLGDKIFDERVSFYTDPEDPDNPGEPFDAEGFPSQRNVWIENGVLKQLQYDRYWAQRKGVTPTMGGRGGRGGGGGGGGGFGGGAVRMRPGTKTLDELIAGCRRGVLCTHFFYTNTLDPRSMLLTGLTRDGTFLIENGRVVRPVKNFRFNQSVMQMLNSIEEIGKPAPGEGTAPPMRVTDFNFAHVTDAV